MRERWKVVREDSEIDLKPYAYKESERATHSAEIYLRIACSPSRRAYWRMSQRVYVYGVVMEPKSPEP